MAASGGRAVNHVRTGGLGGIHHPDHLPHLKLAVPKQPVLEIKHPHNISRPNCGYGPHLNDHDNDLFRTPSTHVRLEDDRLHFESRLQQLKDGYTSKNTLGSYSLGRTLGEGSFGRVVLAEDRSVSPPRKLAIKVMSKSHIARERQVEHTHHEKNILFSVRCPFIVKFVDYFMDRTSLYIVQELCVGGEFYNFLQDRPKGRLTASEAKFYAAQTVLAFEYLHNLEIIFRDLKPENMLLDQNGNIKLVDFGFAKRVKDKTYTFCGTPEYLAPELLSNSGYDYAVDWWAIGVLIYEMRAGKSPFVCFSDYDMVKKIKAGRYIFPTHFSIKEKLLVGGLLQVDVTRRLGKMAGGPGLVKRQPYFEGVDWNALIDGSLKPPIELGLASPDDLSNFGAIEDGESSGLADGRDAGLMGGTRITWHGDSVPGEYASAFDYF